MWEPGCGIKIDLAKLIDQTNTYMIQTFTITILSKLLLLVCKNVHTYRLQSYFLEGLRTYGTHAPI